MEVEHNALYLLEPPTPPTCELMRGPMLMSKSWVSYTDALLLKQEHTRLVGWSALGTHPNALTHTHKEIFHSTQGVVCLYDRLSQTYTDGLECIGDTPQCTHPHTQGDFS